MSFLLPEKAIHEIGVKTALAMSLRVEPQNCKHST